MQTVLLFSDNQIWTQQNIVHLEQQLPYKFTSAGSIGEVEESLSRNKIDLVVFRDLSSFEQASEAIKDLRFSGYRSSILYISPKLKNKNLFRLAEDLKVYVLQNPYLDKDLEGLIRKLMYFKKVPQQLHQRYLTSQRAYVEDLFNREAFPSTIKNLSLGGAYLEFDGDCTLAVGTHVKMNIDLEDVKVAHKLTAKVVWTKNSGLSEGKKGAGVIFLAPNT